MSIWMIAWRSIQQRALASSLTAFSMSLGVMLVVAVLTIHGVLQESFRNNANLGYNMIVGAKGGKLQLTLNSVYYLSQPIENISYDFYTEFLPRKVRDEELLTAIRQDKESRDGEFAAFVDFAIPLCLGDYFGRFRVVGTTPDMFRLLKFGPDGDRSYKFAQGRNMVRKSEEHGFFEAVVGSTVAREMKVRVGDRISTTHGDPEGFGHGQQFTVVGILAPSGTPNDRAAFVNMEGFYLMKGHAKPLDDAHDEGLPGLSEPPSDPAAQLAMAPLPFEQREVTAILVRTSSILVVPSMQNRIDEGVEGQAVFPVLEIFTLFDVFVRPVQLVLLVLTITICVVSGVSILVSIYNSMAGRRHEIAVMRALGASRGVVSSIVLAESIMLSFGGGMIGWLMGHGLNWAAGPLIERRTGVAIGFLDFASKVNLHALLGGGGELEWLSVSSELLLVPSLLLLAVLVGFLPAVAAYRTDVAGSLGK
ncbi:MAG: FtsX-like permease family protein [Planctomycetes bacterium]|nr:FtsX-like permease family protein [Planctomycetota bacterium]